MIENFQNHFFKFLILIFGEVLSIKKKLMHAPKKSHEIIAL
jgi:hypothetical protein